MKGYITDASIYGGTTYMEFTFMAAIVETIPNSATGIEHGTFAFV